MRTDSSFGGEPASFTLVCPGYRRSEASSGSSETAGRLTFTIGSQVVAEIGHADLLESWAEAEDLSPAEARRMSEVAAAHLSDLLDSGLPAGDLTEAVTDAAVVFLLAMKRSGISDPKRIPACTVMWNGQSAREHVMFAS
jgi:hypothetical protein